MIFSTHLFFSLKLEQLRYRNYLGRSSNLLWHKIKVLNGLKLVSKFISNFIFFFTTKITYVTKFSMIFEDNRKNHWKFCKWTKNGQSFSTNYEPQYNYLEQVILLVSNNQQLDQTRFPKLLNLHVEWPVLLGQDRSIPSFRTVLESFPSHTARIIKFYHLFFLFGLSKIFFWFF